MFCSRARKAGGVSSGQEIFQQMPALLELFLCLPGEEQAGQRSLQIEVDEKDASIELPTSG